MKEKITHILQGPSMSSIYRTRTPLLHYKWSNLEYRQCPRLASGCSDVWSQFSTDFEFQVYELVRWTEKYMATVFCCISARGWPCCLLWHIKCSISNIVQVFEPRTQKVLQLSPSPHWNLETAMLWGSSTKPLWGKEYIERKTLPTQLPQLSPTPTKTPNEPNEPHEKAQLRSEEPSNQPPELWKTINCCCFTLLNFQPYFWAMTDNQKSI